MNKLFTIALTASIISGWSVQKNWIATGGSKADGTIKLSYEHSRFEKPQLSEQQALSQAKRRCNAWGYSQAEAFGGTISQCNSGSISSCKNWFVTKEYQCMD